MSCCACKVPSAAPTTSVSSDSLTESKNFNAVQLTFPVAGTKVPPFYSGIGESIRKFFTKSFEYGHAANLDRIVSGGVKVSAKLTPNGASSTLKYANQYITLEDTLDTTGKFKADATSVFADQSVVLRTALGFDHSDSTGCAQVFILRHTRDYLAASLNLQAKTVQAGEKTELQKSVQLSATVGDKVSGFGAQIAVNPSAADLKKDGLTAYDFATYYNCPSAKFSVSLSSVEKLTGYKLAYHKVVNPANEQEIGFQFSETPCGRTLSVAAQQRLDNQTVARGVIDSTGSAQVAASHTLADGSYKLALAAKLQPLKSLVPTTVGVNVSVGDF